MRISIRFFFDCEEWESLWHELKSIVVFWIERGVRIFRVDNPHTKPLPFWQWLIAEVRSEYPDIVFLSEAFTRSRVMYGLGESRLQPILYLFYLAQQ